MTNGLRARDAAPLTTLACIFMPHCICVTAARLPSPHVIPFLHRHGICPLHWAARGGYCAIVRLLMGARAKVNVKDKRYNAHDERRARS